jgi:hypothetical protein
MRITIVILHTGQPGIIGFYGMGAQDDIVQRTGWRRQPIGIKILNLHIGLQLALIFWERFNNDSDSPARVSSTAPQEDKV